MARHKQLPPAKNGTPTEVDRYWHDGLGVTIIVYEDYTPEMGRQATSNGGWGRFSGVGNKFTAGRGASGG